MSNERILIVEDDRPVAQLIEAQLRKFGYEVIGHASSGEQAVEAARSGSPNLALIDVILDGPIDGVEAARRMRFDLNIPVVFLTGLADAATLKSAKTAEPLGYILKPFKAEELKTTVEVALHQFDVVRRHAEEALRESEEKYRTLFESSRDAIMMLDRDGFFDCNHTTLEMFRCSSKEEFVSRHPGDLSPPKQSDGSDSLEAARHHIEVAFSVGVDFFEWTYSRMDGTLFQAEVLLSRLENRGRIVLQSSVRDISERKSAEQQHAMMEIQLRQALKLEAVGQLAAGIAHEINTPTQYVGDNIRFLQEAFGDLRRVLECYERLVIACRRGNVDSALLAEVERTIVSADLGYLIKEIPQAIEQSLEGTGRVATIVRAMKEFSHPGGDEKQTIDLNRSIESTLTVCRNEWKYVAEMTTELDRNLPPVSCLPGDLNQVILNLVVNAAHAIGDVVGDGSKGKGRITVSTSREDGWAVIRVSDTGTGIPEKARGRIFEPFFTTKEVGKGSGQGLAISRAVIVGKHGGTIGFETETGRGTTFTVRLPIGSGRASAQ